MPVNGSLPHNHTERAYGHTTLPVQNIRTQSLQPGQLVLYRGKKYTVRATNKNAEGWYVQLSDPKGKLTATTRPAGHTWPVLNA
jgi:hypothetical protein